VLGSESLYPAYYFLVDSNVIDVHHDIDRTGPLLCVAAGSREAKRYALVEFLLKRGASPSDRADMYGDRTALASAAGNSDKKMVS
jgi:ankyrin repeat protein